MKNIPGVDVSLKDAMVWTRGKKRGGGVCFTSNMIKCVIYLVTAKAMGVVTALIVAQLGATTSLIVNIDLGLNLTGTAKCQKL